MSAVIHRPAERSEVLMWLEEVCSELRACPENERLRFLAIEICAMWDIPVPDDVKPPSRH